MGGPFALSVPGYKLGVHTRRHKKLNEERQGSQSSSLSPSPSLPDVPSSSLPSGSINPLSHTPDTLRQFAVAGLSPEEELPSKLYPSFPHRPLPPEYPSGSREKKSRRISMSRTSAGEGEDKRETTVQQHSARLKHLNTMTAIMHRCLNDGDISRAKRAFGLLVQTKEIDIRLNNLWAIGSEILMRAPETAQSGETSSTNDGDSPLPAPLPRWGSAANVEKVKDYFENLIQQYPHDPYRPHLTSAIDFWPALFGIEVYNVNAEFQRALYQLDTKGEEEEVDAEMDDEFGEEEYPGEDFDDERRRQRKEDARLEALWAAKDEVRQKTQVAARHIATRMDQLMENAPYATHHELLHLRGNVSLFIADLYLPARLVETGDAVIVERMEVLSLRDRNLRARLDGAEDDHLALGNRKEEQDKARSFFQRILDNGGEVSSWIRKFMDSEDHEHDIGLAEAAGF